MKTLAKVATAWLIFGSVMSFAFYHLQQKPDTFIQVNILKIELDNARRTCHSSKTDTLIGVYDSQKHYKLLPCSDLIVTENIQ